MPFNKSFGTEEINKYVATHLAVTLNAEVWEIFTGITKKYLRIGERVLYNKSEAIVTEIKPNPSYYGKKPRPPSATMNYSGVETNPSKIEEYLTSLGSEANGDVDFIDRMFEAMANHTDDEESTSRQSSHIVVVQPSGTEDKIQLRAVGDIAALSLAYAISIHKSQGSEYDRVFFISHKSNAPMYHRELLYTAVTRAKKELVIICEPDLFVKGITTQKLPGTTAKDKVDNFDRYIMQQARLGEGNIDQVPIGLEALIAKNVSLSPDI